MNLQHLYDNTRVVGTFETFKRALEVAADSQQAFDHSMLEHTSIKFSSPLDSARHHELIVAPKAIEACAHAEMIGTVYCLNDETVHEIICEIVEMREMPADENSTPFGDAVTAGLFNAAIKVAADSYDEYKKAAQEFFGKNFDKEREGCTYNEALNRRVLSKRDRANKEKGLVAKIFSSDYFTVDRCVWQEVNKRRKANQA